MVSVVHTSHMLFQFCPSDFLVIVSLRRYNILKISKITYISTLLSTLIPGYEEVKFHCRMLTNPNTIRGYFVFEGYIEFESQIHFKSLEIEHRVFDQKLEETNYKFGYRFSGPHEYDEVLRCESTGQQRKIVRIY